MPTKVAKSLDYAELTAKHVLEAALPGAKMEYRLSQSNGEYDFDLHYPDGTLAAVEVTRSLDLSQMQTSAAISSTKKRPVINAVKCKNTWMITPMQNANILAIRKSVDEYLSVLEAAGVKEFSAFDAHRSRQIKQAVVSISSTTKQAGLLELFEAETAPQCVEDICFELNIEGGGTISSDGSPKIILGHPTYGGAVGPNCAIEAGGAECWKTDNRKKLGAAATKERHLVVYIEVTKGSAWLALTEFDPPTTLPDLPPEISHIWLIGDIGQDKLVVWHATRSEFWKKSEVVIQQRVAV